MSNEESAERTSGKWAGEAFDGLRLFQRTGNKVSGLVMLIIGWALLLVLLSGLAPDAQTPIIGIPWYTGNLQLMIRDVRLTSLFSIGSIIIAIIWAFRSGFYLYLAYPLRRLLRSIAILLAHLLFVFVGVISIPVYFLSYPVWEFRSHRWKSRYDPKDIEGLIEKFGKEALNEQIAEEIGFSPIWLLTWGGGMYSKTIEKLVSAGRIGLAPLYSYSFDEDQQAAKAPMQIFAAAIGQMRSKLNDFDAVRLIQFITLPEIVNVTTDGRARQLRRWMGLDAVLWGSYLSTTPPRIWLNIEQSLNEKLMDKHVFKRGNDDPFNAFLNTNESMVVIDQQDPLDAYIVLLLALILSLRARQVPKITLYSRAYDRLHFVSEDPIITHLIRDTLFAIPQLPSTFLPYPVAKEVMVTLASNWIAQQLGTLGQIRTTTNYELLRDIALKCIQLQPDNPRHYYQLTTIHCLLDNESDALDILEKALEKDKDIHWVDKTNLYAMAMAETMMLRYQDNEVHIAKLVSYAARAVKFCGEWYKDSLRTDFLNTDLYELRKLGVHTAQLSVSEKILYDLLDIELPNSI